MSDQPPLTHPGNLYVRGLTADIATGDLHQLFGPFGEIVSCKIVSDDYGRSRGYGFVNFAQGSSADEAIEKLNGLLVNGSKLYLNHHIAKRERLERMDYEKSHFTSLYVTGFPDSWGEEELRELFAQHGEVVSVQLLERERSPPEEKPKRFGFVGFELHRSALQALELNGHEIDSGERLLVSRAQRRDERTRSHSPTFVPQAQLSPPVPTMPSPFFPLPGPNQQQSNLYVKNLGPRVTDDSLYSAFAPYGIIVSAKIMTLEDGTPRGFGFVCFKTVQEASRALVSMNGTELDGQVVHVSFAQRNNRRKHSSSSSLSSTQVRFANYPPLYYPQQFPYPYPQPKLPIQVNDYDRKIMELSAEVSHASEEQKRERLLNELIVPKLREEGREDHGDEVLDKLLAQYEGPEKWLDMINDLASEQQLTAQLHNLSV